MSEVPISYYLYLSAFLFSAGIFIVLAKRSAVFVLIGIELILNGSNLLLATFGKSDPTFQGQILAIFSIVLTVCEVAVALAILLNIYRKFSTTDLDELTEIGNEGT